jgi:LCP family protein required for cell wall assembly
MTGTFNGNDPGGSAQATARHTSTVAEAEMPVKRKPRGRRNGLLSGLGVLVLIGAAAAAGFLIVNNLVSRVPRINVGRLPPAGVSQTILITGTGFGATGGSAPVSSRAQFSGLIMLLHINVRQKAAAVVSIPPRVMVQVPGKGTIELQSALADGGPALLVRTVGQLTHVQINHYARVDFNHVAKVIDALGGVDVSLLKPSAGAGYTFHAGINHLNGATALSYARDTSTTDRGRILRQQNLLRAIMSKLGHRHLLTTPMTMVHVLGALTSMMTVDSNFTNSELMALAKELATLGGQAPTFVTAPSHIAGEKLVLDTPMSSQLWRAIAHDSVAAFARKDPSTVTPPVLP